VLTFTLSAIRVWVASPVHWWPIMAAGAVVFFAVGYLVPAGAGPDDDDDDLPRGHVAATLPDSAPAAAVAATPEGVTTAVPLPDPPAVVRPRDDRVAAPTETFDTDFPPTPAAPLPPSDTM
jgi:hypothetical protein